MPVVARKGFDATVEEIARSCAVSPRTIFRHFESHDVLIVETVKVMFDAMGHRATGIPPLTDDVWGWLEGLAKIVHERNAEILGDAFWDTHAPPPAGSGVLRNVATLRRDFRLRGVGYLTEIAWQAAGGVGQPPDLVRMAFALLFSAFTTQALMVDFERRPDEIGELTAQLLKLLLLRALEDQRPVGPADDVGAWTADF